MAKSFHFLLDVDVTVAAPAFIGLDPVVIPGIAFGRSSAPTTGCSLHTLLSTNKQPTMMMVGRRRGSASLLAATVCCFLCLLCTMHADTDKEDRPPSMFQVGEEWLALPEVFSNLDFTADSTPASEEDVEGQLRLRASRFWGRLYIDGWPQTVQFFRAHFGIEPPTGRKVFVFPDPRDACEEIKNPEYYTEDHVLLVNRGKCTFGTKAKNAQKTKATGIVIVNNEPGIDHLPGPDAHDISYSVSSIPQPEGQLLEAVYDEGPPDVQPSDGLPGPGHVGLGRRMEGYIVPINCENGGAKCVPATYDERKQVANLTEGGFVRLASPLGEGDLPVEYLLAHFGTKVRVRAYI